MYSVFTLFSYLAHASPDADTQQPVGRPPICSAVIHLRAGMSRPANHHRTFHARGPIPFFALFRLIILKDRYNGHCDRETLSGIRAIAGQHPTAQVPNVSFSVIAQFITQRTPFECLHLFAQHHVILIK